MNRTKPKKYFFEKEKISLPRTKIKVIGIGGGGNSIVAEIAPQIKKVDFVVANTDFQALQESAKKGQCKTFLFGQNITRNLGTGMDPNLGEMAAEEEIERIEKLFQGVNLSILVVSLGGGTGSGALPVFAKAAKKGGGCVLGIFTLPFKFEGEKKVLIAKKSLEKAENHLQGLILTSNQKVFNIVEKTIPFQEALSCINKILSESLGSLIEIFYSSSFINIDFSDLKTILKGREKLAYLHSVTTEGEDRAEKTVRMIFQNPISEHSLKRPKRILFNIAGNKDLKISEIEKIAKAIYEKNPQAKIVFGISQKRKYEKKIKLSILALGGFKKEKPKEEKIISQLETKKQKKDIKFFLKKDKGQKDAGQKKKKLSAKNEKDKELSSRGAGKINILTKKPRKKAIPLRRNALALKKEVKKAEKELLAQESQWDTPAFLRRKK